MPVMPKLASRDDFDSAVARQRGGCLGIDWKLDVQIVQASAQGRHAVGTGAEARAEQIELRLRRRPQLCSSARYLTTRRQRSR